MPSKSATPSGKKKKGEVDEGPADGDDEKKARSVYKHIYIDLIMKIIKLH